MFTNDGGTATQPRAPGHERPRAALRAARHGRLSAASTAPGADVPRATSVRAPGQYCQSAAPQAPGHGSPLAIAAGAAYRDRLSAAPIATVSSPAGPLRLCQEGLPHYPANPRTLIHPHTHRDTAHTRSTDFRAILSPCIAGGPQGGQPLLPSPNVGEGPGVRPVSPSPGACSGGGLGRGRRPVHPATHQVHPAIQVPPHPRPCSTADTGLSAQHPSRAPPRGLPFPEGKGPGVRSVPLTAGGPPPPPPAPRRSTAATCERSIGSDSAHMPRPDDSITPCAKQLQVYAVRLLAVRRRQRAVIAQRLRREVDAEQRSVAHGLRRHAQPPEQRVRFRT